MELGTQRQPVPAAFHRPGGMSYLRVVPSADIERISSQPNDVEQELRYHTRPDLDGISLSYPAYDPLDDSPEMPPVMLHYAVNRPVGRSGVNPT